MAEHWAKMHAEQMAKARTEAAERMDAALTEVRESERKRAAEDFDQEVARLEKRIAIYSQSKAASAKAKVTAFEIELDALLERGPAEPSDDEEIEDDSDKGNESQQDEQEEGEEAGEDGEA